MYTAKSIKLPTYPLHIKEFKFEMPKVQRKYDNHIV